MPRTNQARRTEEKIQYYQILMNNIQDPNSAHKASIGRLIELMQGRESDLDNNLGTYNLKDYSARLKAQLSEIVNTYEELENAHGKGNVPEDAGMPPQIIEGIRFMIKGLDNGWNPEELGVLAFLGEAKAELEMKKNTLSEQEFAKYKNTERNLDELINKCTFNPVSDRVEKTKLAEEINEFASFHQNDGSLYENSRLFHNFDEDTQAEAGDIADPYKMNGASRADQMSDIMHDLDAVDGTFQHSSPNFRALRQKIEELNKLAKNNPEDMTREELDAYLEKVDEVKAAAKAYLDGKNAEIRQYRRNHDNEDPELKDITKKRMNFAMELADRLTLHLNHSVKNFDEDVSLDSRAHTFALLARRMREEDNFRKKNLPTKPIDADNLFLQSVFRSMYLESVRSQYLTDQNYNEARMENALSKASIEEGTQTIKNYFRHFNLERDLVKDINNRVRLGNTDYGREFITSEIHQEMRKLNQMEDDPLFTSKEEIMGTFAYENMANDEAEDEKAGFGRYDDYFDRDERGDSEIEELELKLGIKKSEEDRLKDFGENAEAEKKADMTQYNQAMVYGDIPEGPVSESDAREFVTQYMMNLYYADYPEERPNDFNGEVSEKTNLVATAIAQMVEYMDLSNMTGPELIGFFEAGARNGMIRDMEKNAEAAADVELAKKNNTKVTKETLDRAKDYKALIDQGKGNKTEAEEEEKFFKQPGLVILKTDLVINPNESISVAVSDHLKKEEIIRKKLIQEIKKDQDNIKNDNQKDVENINAVVNENDVENMKEALISSACRSLFIEMVREKYVKKEEYYDGQEFRTAETVTDEKKYKQVLILGLKDKANMQEFTELMKTSFGETFKGALRTIMTEEGELTHKSILKARDYALSKEFSEAMPSKYDRDAHEKGEKKDNLVKAEEIRRLGIKLGSHVMDKIKDIDLGLTREEKGKVKKWAIQTDYDKPVARHSAPFIDMRPKI